MRKGVSPVVATVLLIAIAVISSVAVWYWVAPLTSAQPTPSTTQSAYIVTNVYKNASNSSQCVALDIKNSGGVVISANTVFEIRYQSTGAASNRYVNITIALNPGSTLGFNISNVSNMSSPQQYTVPLGTYTMRASSLSPGAISGFGDVYFTC